MNNSGRSSRAVRAAITLIVPVIALPLDAAAPAWDWPTATPESEGMSSARLNVIKDRLAAKKTRAFLVVCNDHVVYEWYAPGVTATTKQGTASLAKALVGGMSLAVAMTDGKISIDDTAAKFVPQWKDDPRKSKVTIRHLGSHTSGLSDSTTENVKHEEQPGWMGDFWKRLDPPRDPFTLARDETPMLSAPGGKLQYSNPGIGMMSYCVTAAIRDGEHKDIRTLLRERVMRPIGVADAEWSVGYEKTFMVDRLPLVATWGGGAYTPRATARIGRLVLRDGNWEGRQILSKDAVRQVTGDAGLVGNCGMGWWGNGGQRYSKLPKDAVWGAGAGDQLLLVVPGLNLIMVRNGETLAPGPGEPPVRDDDVFTKYHDYRARILFEPLVEAVTRVEKAESKKQKAEMDRSLLTPAAPGAPPPSSFIKEIRWAPVETIRRAAKGSDNWPLTWADDDALYGAYGDGNGFEPFIAEKLSMGFARITGGPSDFTGTNVRSNTGETRGDGSAGKKASGLLCVDGTLYLWTRNAANSQLVWSGDHGITWSWADWRFTESFGCPAFLNFGRNYAGARDDFVYIYSLDANSAYQTADQLELARAPETLLRDRASYEFFSGLDSAGKPQWTHDLAQRRAVFTHAAHCYRSSISYVAALRRYLLVQPVPGVASRDKAGQLDTRSNGGLAIYDAPEPWGPWTTAFFTDHWDVGPGDSASFPSKWMSADGTALHLVFSGDDYFSVRKATLMLAGADLTPPLAQFDATVLSPQERKAAAQMVGENVERRLREANERSSTEWKAIKSREEWERFRAAKLAALRNSLGQPATPGPLPQRVTGTLSGDGYRIENVVYQSSAGVAFARPADELSSGASSPLPFPPGGQRPSRQSTGATPGATLRPQNVSTPRGWITANLYRPEKARQSMPGILISHAHHTPKEHGELQDMGVTWARAGCLVLVPDHVGHGERRQHPFRSATDYAGSFQVSRQDYFFRYDAAIQLHLAGESLIGWMARDLMRGVDFLLEQENIDPKRIILLGAVAGGGDPAAVTAALDERIAAAVPFNFGGPQPETRYPLPDNAEAWFNYAGGGSWESTRNLRRSASDGFLPWVIVGGIAPRRLIYGHEFSWDREHDPVWHRLQTIYGFYRSPDHLAFTHGRGELRGQPPEASHCTHIGPPHRQLIHAAFKEWFGIDVTGDSSDRHPAEALRAMTVDAERELQPKKLTDILSELAAERVRQARLRLAELPPDQRRHQLQTDWARLLGNAAAPTPTPTPSTEKESKITIRSKSKDGEAEEAREISIERILLTVEPSIVVPVLLLKPNDAGAGKRVAKPGLVVAVAQDGKQKLMRERSSEIAALLETGMAVCLPDVRGTGETSPGAGRGRRSAATSFSSSELMLGGTMLGAQLRDLRAVLAWLRTRDDLDARQLSMWGDSLTRPNPPDTNFQIPRDDDDALPRSPEPLGGLLALLAALYEDDVRTVYAHGGLASFESVLTKHLALIPHDAVVPGALTAGDLCDLVAALAPRRVRLEGMVDGWNRTLSASELASAYESASASYRTAGAPAQFSLSPERTSFVQWLADGKAGRAR